ncbi:thiamine phosphate synthase [Corynebacterium ulcerans]|uniref:thiamine phosphate synthase n=1 Tax=Corynebacterium ulcerans TaxID=65058 RepID=UPI0018D786E4|nr:thiamine phosphate synthase [Corynebacterium ulcerans]
MRKTTPPVDLRCYFVTGHSPDPRHIVHIAVAAAAGGAGIIQIRSKPISARDLYKLSSEVACAVATINPFTRVLIDDRLDVAIVLRSQNIPIAGVHVGQDDLSPHICRKLLGPEAIIGLTTGSLELVEKANTQAEYIDYIGCGPFRETPTKDSGRAPLGLDSYAELVARSAVPLVAIGGITLNDAAPLAAQGVSGLAVVRGFMEAADPTDFASKVLREFDRGASQWAKDSSCA